MGIMCFLFGHKMEHSPLNFTKNAPNDIFARPDGKHFNVKQCKRCGYTNISELAREHLSFILFSQPNKDKKEPEE